MKLNGMQEQQPSQQIPDVIMDQLEMSQAMLRKGHGLRSWYPDSRFIGEIYMFDNNAWQKASRQERAAKMRLLWNGHHKCVQIGTVSRNASRWECASKMRLDRKGTQKGVQIGTGTDKASRQERVFKKRLDWNGHQTKRLDRNGPQRCFQTGTGSKKAC